MSWNTGDDVSSDNSSCPFSLDDEGEVQDVQQHPLPEISSREVMQEPEGDKSSNEVVHASEGDKKKETWQDEEEQKKDSSLGMPKMINLRESGLRRSTRDRKPSRHAVEKSSSTIKRITGLFAMTCFFTIERQALKPLAPAIDLAQKAILTSQDLSRNLDGTMNELSPIGQIFSASAGNETYTFNEAMKQKDAPSFISAMQKEADDHDGRRHWNIVRRDEAGNPQTILEIWSFKRKQHPDGSLNKHKARLCAHGGMQQWGVNYWETFPQ